MILLVLLFSGLLLGLRFGVVELGIAAIVLVIAGIALSPTAEVLTHVSFAFWAMVSMQLGYAVGLFIRASAQGVKDDRKATTWRR
jgi:hypothetical protein